MKDLMKSFIALFILVSTAAAESLSGTGNFRMHGVEPSSFSFTITYSPSGKAAREKVPKSAIEAIREIATISISFGPNRTLKSEYPFYITQYPDDKAYSLVGFYITDGYPHVLKIDTWKREAPFCLYESYRSPEAVLTGNLRKNK